MSQLMIILSVLGLSGLFGAPDKIIVHTVSKQDMLLLKRVDQKYKNNHGIHLQLKKTITLSMLGSSKNSEGEVWINKGQLRLQINKPEPSKIIAGKKYLWIESQAPEGFGEASSKLQVVQTTLDSKKAQSQALIQLLANGGILKFFRVSGIQKANGRVTYFLQPDKQSVEFKRAQIVVNPKSLVIEKLKYWDQVDNETTYSFSDAHFNKKIDPKLFSYKPPKDAELIVY